MYLRNLHPIELNLLNLQKIILRRFQRLRLSLREEGKEVIEVRTNIDLNDKLVKEAMTICDYKTKKELINSALKEFVNRLKRKDILKLMGSNCWEGNLTKMRRSRF